VVGLPPGAVGEDDPLDTFVERVGLDLPEVFCSQLGSDALDLDEGDKVLVYADSVVSELASNLVLGTEVLELVEAQRVG